ncbi:hypothetical protein [Sphingomonas changbaiensis]|uniref:hypothetical protein n=1 Tax=Sphingomonas changbaiensis TaxID=529705 RepID=UPI0014704686|nr:hypothetical protein [Sphingomonas changbaiensis]
MLRLFGAPALLLGEHGIRLSRRATALLAYVALQPGRPVSRAALVDLLWPGRFPAHARGSLRHCLAELRNAPVDHPLIVTEGDAVIASGGIATDVSTFEQRGGAELLAELETLSPGPPLAGLDVSPPMEAWVAGARRALERRIRQHVLGAVELASTAKDWSLARRLGESWLARAPEDEDMTALVMRCEIEMRVPDLAAARYERLVAREAAPAGVGSIAAEPPPPTAAPLLLVAQMEGTAADAERMSLVLREELLVALSRFRDLRLISAPHPLDALEDGKSRIGYALGATLHSDAIIVTLLELPSRTVLWCERTSLGSGEKVQTALDHIVGRTAAAVLPAVDAHAMLRPHASGPLYSQYVAARTHAIQARSFADAVGAASALEVLIASAPDFAPPMLALARLLNTDFGYTRAGSSGPPERERAFALTRRALSLDRHHVHAYTVMGWCHLWRGDWALAQRNFEKAVELNPHHPERLVEAAFGSLFLGDLSTASALFDRCLALEPHLDDRFRADRGLLHLLSGEFDRALQEFLHVADRRGWVVLYELAASALAGANTADARAEAASWLAAIWPDGRVPSQVALAEWIRRQRPFRLIAHRDLLIEGLRLGLS